MSLLWAFGYCAKIKHVQGGEASFLTTLQSVAQDLHNYLHVSEICLSKKITGAFAKRAEKNMENTTGPA